MQKKQGKRMHVDKYLFFVFFLNNLTFSVLTVDTHYRTLSRMDVSRLCVRVCV